VRFIKKLQLRLRSLLLRSRVEAELDDELRFHLEQQAGGCDAYTGPGGGSQYMGLN
jgi:hypothetical protein